MKDIVTIALYGCGWDILGDNNTAIAKTEYDTCCGVKLAHAYLSNNVLSFDYNSEGRNIVEPFGVLLPVKRTDNIEMISEIIQKRAKAVHEHIMQSYGVQNKDY